MAKPICSRISCSKFALPEAWASEITYSENPTAQNRVSKFPKLSCPPAWNSAVQWVWAGIVSNPTPSKATKAPVQAGHPGAFVPGGRSPGIVASSGTITTTNAVIKAEFVAVV